MAEPMSGAMPACSAAEIQTPNAARYLQQLCKHFQHKRPVTCEAAAGQIGFSLGECRLRAEGGVLTLSLEAPDAGQLEQLQGVVARHLLRFAFREDLRIDWRVG